MAMSQQATRPTPPPNAAPWTRAMVGFGSSSKVRISRARVSASSRFSASPAAAMPRIQFRSAPAENEAPVPSSTTTRTVGSLPAESSALVRAAISPASNALCRPGRSRTRCVTAPRRWIDSDSGMTRPASPTGPHDSRSLPRAVRAGPSGALNWMRHILMYASMLPRRLLATLLASVALICSFAHASDAAVATTWRLLDYIAVDYREAVADGEVVNQLEYDEMLEFSATAAAAIEA